MTSEERFVAAAVSSWKLIIGRISDGIAPHSDEHFQRQVAPGKNRLIYLIGHLTAVHDRMFTMLDLGPRLYPELDDPYLNKPDRTLPDPILAADLKKAWTEVNTKLTAAFEAFTPEDWLRKHTAVSDEDFAKDPSRNCLAVLMSRTNHASFHAGQMILARE